MLPTSTLTVLVFGALLGLLWLSTVPLTSGLVALMFGTRHAGMLFGFVFLSHQVGAFAGVWLGGAIYEATGAYDAMWWISIALGLGAAIVHLPIHERRAPRWAPAPGVRLRTRSRRSARVLAVLAIAGAYWQAERTAAFERQDGTGETLRLVCPLH